MTPPLYLQEETGSRALGTPNRRRALSSRLWLTTGEFSHSSATSCRSIFFDSVSLEFLMLCQNAAVKRGSARERKGNERNEGERGLGWV